MAAECCQTSEKAGFLLPAFGFLRTFHVLHQPVLAAVRRLLVPGEQKKDLFMAELRKNGTRRSRHCCFSYDVQGKVCGIYIQFIDIAAAYDA